MLKLRQLMDPNKPKRSLGLLVGGSIVAASMSLLSPSSTSQAAKDASAPEPEAQVCTDDVEVSRLSRHLKARHEGLRADFLALEREQEELGRQREALDGRLEELRELRREVTSRIARWQARDARERSTRLRQLINIVNEMKPLGAARLLAKSEPELSADVLLQLEEKHAGRILENMPPDTAADLARRLAAFRSKQKKEAAEAKEAP
jgi:flagellar motility protein MotE (MotC chaperone)